MLSEGLRVTFRGQAWSRNCPEWVAFAFRKNRLAAVLTGLTFVPPTLLALMLRFGPSFGLNTPL